VGLRCADTAAGKGCLPACQGDTDCPVGQGCRLGECYTPGEDAGCGALCTPVDAGVPIVVTPRDAGTGGGGRGGCGCAADGGSAPWGLLGALVSLLWSRRNTWRVRSQ
jgi:MYXO-CTERM domain-containing protein